jgi:hypothetical protein
MKKFCQHILIIVFLACDISVTAMQQKQIGSYAFNLQPFIDRKHLRESLRAPYRSATNKQLKEAAQELFINPSRGYLVLKEPTLIEKYKKEYENTRLAGQQKENFIRNLLDQDEELKQLYPDIEGRLALVGAQTGSFTDKPSKKNVHFDKSNNYTFDGGFISASELQMHTDKAVLLKNIVHNNQAIEKQLKTTIEKPPVSSNKTLLGYYQKSATDNENVFIIEDKSIVPQKTQPANNNPTPSIISRQEINEIDILLQKQAQRTTAIHLALQSPQHPWLEEEQQYQLTKIKNYSNQYGTVVTAGYPDILQAAYFLSNEYPALNLFLSIIENKNSDIEKAKQELCTTPAYESSLGLSYYYLLGYLKNPQKKFSKEYEQKLCQQVMTSEYNIHANTTLKNKTAILKLIETCNILSLLSQDKRNLSKLLFANRHSLDLHENNKEILELYGSLPIGIEITKAYVDIRNNYHEFEKKYPLADRYSTLLKLFLIKTSQEKASRLESQEEALFTKWLNKKLCIDDPSCALAHYQAGLAKFNKAKKNNSISTYCQALHYWLKAAQLGNTDMLDAIITLKDSSATTFPVVASCNHILLSIPEKNRQQLPQKTQDVIKRLIQLQTETKKIVDDLKSESNLHSVDIKREYTIHDVIRAAYQTNLLGDLTTFVQNMSLDEQTFESFLLCLNAERLLDKMTLLERIANDGKQVNSLIRFCKDLQPQSNGVLFLEYVVQEYCKQKSPHAAYLQLLLSAQRQMPMQKIKQNKVLQTFINHPALADVASVELLELITNHLVLITNHVESSHLLKEFNFSAAGLAARLLKQPSSAKQKSWGTVYVQNFARNITQSIQTYQTMFNANKKAFNQLYHDVTVLNKEQLEMPTSELDIFHYYYGIINNKIDLVTEFLEKQKKEKLLTDNVLAYCASQKELKLLKNDRSIPAMLTYMEKLQLSLRQGNADAYYNYLNNLDKYRAHLKNNKEKFEPKEIWLKQVTMINPEQINDILYAWLAYLVNNKRFDDAYTFSFSQSIYPISIAMKISFIKALLIEAVNTIDKKIKLCATDMKTILDYWQEALAVLQNTMILYHNNPSLFTALKQQMLFEQLNAVYKAAHKEDSNCKYTKNIEGLRKWQDALRGYEAFLNLAPTRNGEEHRALLAAYTDNRYNQAHLYLSLAEYFLKNNITLAEEFCKKGEESTIKIQNKNEQLKMMGFIQDAKNNIFHVKKLLSTNPPLISINSSAKNI